MGGRDAFLDACIQADSESSRTFLALYRSLPLAEQQTTTLQDLCTRCDTSATDLVGSMMGKLIMQSNNVALLKSALRRPEIMDANIELALGDSEYALEAQKLQFQIAGFIKGEGKQIVNLTQNVQGTGILSFEDDSHQSTASVKAEGRPVTPASSDSAPFDADGELVVLDKGN
jgi:predicted O-linked N-acetylglucosamine transferase (SPINDLY family)